MKILLVTVHLVHAKRYGKHRLSLVAAGWSKSVAVKVCEPILIFIFACVARLALSSLLPSRGGAAFVHAMKLVGIPNVRSALSSK